MVLDNRTEMELVIRVQTTTEFHTSVYGTGEIREVNSFFKKFKTNSEVGLSLNKNYFLLQKQVDILILANKMWSPNPLKL